MAADRGQGRGEFREAGSDTEHHAQERIPQTKTLAEVERAVVEGQALLGGEAETLSVGLDPSLLASGAARLSCSDALRALSAARG